VPTIVLARHGRPGAPPRHWIPGRSLTDWVRARDLDPLDRGCRPPAELERIANGSGLIAASPLRRSLESVELLRPGCSPLVELLFREVYRPTALRTGVRLPPSLWSLFTRIAWYYGWSPGVESYAGARRRAAVATERLTALAAEHGSVLLVGHGLMDGLIGQRLRRAGWAGPPFRPRRYWAFTRYERA
jgi:broad specificity phosphatase PhoE